jgi:hypothetical protein
LIAAHHALSSIRLEDTVLAEGIVDEEWIDALRGRTVDFSKEELSDRLESYGIETATNVIPLLVQAGVLRRAGGRYKIPTLYRPALATVSDEFELPRGEGLPILDYGLQEDVTDE